eukprot:2985971-Pyramimonas_sp.AAC.1
MSHLETQHVNADTRGTPMDLGYVGKDGKAGGQGCLICGKANHKAHECHWRDSKGKGTGNGKTSSPGGKYGGKGGKGGNNSWNAKGGNAWQPPQKFDNNSGKKSGGKGDTSKNWSSQGKGFGCCPPC